MDIRSIILSSIRPKGSIKVSDIARKTGFSRAYINRFFTALRKEGKIDLVGKANTARYVIANKGGLESVRSNILKVRRILRNKGLNEDIILSEIKRESGIFRKIPKNISDILEYAFTEMLNNAIEHSRSKNIDLAIEREGGAVFFEITDKGIGILRHIQKKRKLKNENEAIQDLIKGKQTTMPERHTGEGIFFTSKAVDVFTIKSSNKKLTFDNIIDDVFLGDSKKIKGTKIFFSISEKSKRKLSGIFKKYSGEEYEFSKTKVVVKLYKSDVGYISRSQARRVISGLDKFKTVILDFKGLGGVGQAFADEIFRVWQRNHPGISISIVNANENVKLMISRAQSAPL